MRVLDISLNVLPMQTRFPFKYGIASMTHLPHLFVTAHIEVNGDVATGLASEGLPPKWFTKIPDTTFEQDLKFDLTVIQKAVETAQSIDEAASFFEFWQRLYHKFKEWWQPEGVAPLLANFALSLVERAALDGWIKARSECLHDVLYRNELGIDFGAIHSQLEGIQPSDFMEPTPRGTSHIRHTVGLGDPLTSADISDGDAPDDDLPFTLEENIREYRLNYFKLKLSGNSDTDCPRMEKVAALLENMTGRDYKVTLDGNEQFSDLSSFQNAWQRLNESEAVADMLSNHLILVEQPVHRSQALAPDIRQELENWESAPPIIIDEADGDLDSLPLALELGYSGTSHKNCKGIIKGLANAALLFHWKKESGRDVILSGEDLANVGPVALLQDLAMMNSLGISHVERNGHHYFQGLSMLPEDIQSGVLHKHGDLYHKTNSGFASLQIIKGKIKTSTINSAPFGTSLLIDAERFTPLSEWSSQNL